MAAAAAAAVLCSSNSYLISLGQRAAATAVDGRACRREFQHSTV